MDNTELFDRYIDGRIEDEELEDFEKKLKADKDFKKSFEEFLNLQKAAEQLMGGNTEEEFDKQLDKETDQLSQEDIDKYGLDKRGSPDEEMSSFRKNIALAEKDFLHDEIRRITSKGIFRLAVAASVIIAVVLTVFFYIRGNRLSNKDLFAEYYETWVKTEKVLEIARSSDDFYYAVKVFESGDYARASLLFMQLSDSVEFHEYASLYTGLTSMQMGKWEDALISLKNAVKTDDIQMECVARWYLGLCFLRIDDSESAREQFKILASSKNDYTIRSQRILRKMK